jgi:hypothetical protein
MENEERYYKEKCEPFKTIIGGLLQKETEILEASRSSPDRAAEKLFELSRDMLNLASCYLVLNNLSLAILKNRSEDALNDARKAIYKAVIYLENIVTGKVNVPYSDYESHVLELVQAVNEQRRFDMVRKMGLAINLLEDAYGNNSKWKWSFVELEGRFAAVAKNMLELSSIVTNTDPLAPAYVPTMRHLGIVKHLLADASTQYRDRYSLSTQRVEDLQSAHNFLESLRYLHIALAEQSEADSAKKQCEIIEQKIENERKKE